MIKTIVGLFFLLCISNFSYARPESIDFVKVLSTSEKIIKIRVISFDEESMNFEDLKTQRNESVFVIGIKKPVNGSNLTGTVPEIGDTVVIVINKRNAVSLFAKKINNNYRFWSPAMSFSIPLFCYTRPAKGLKDKLEEKATQFKSGDGKEYFYCFDGCLLKRKDFEKGKKCFKKKYFERIYKRRTKNK